MSVTFGVAYAVLRLVATLGRGIAVWPDSPSYFVFKLWGGVRFPVVTAFYALVGDHRAIVTVQTLVGALSWPVAAVVAASVLTPRWLRDVLVAAILLLGSTLSVTQFDNALLSESIAISLTVLFVATVLRFACVPTRHGAIAVFVLGVLWAMTRQNHAVLLAIVALLFATLGAASRWRALAWRVAGGFAVAAVAGLLMASSTSQIQQYNTAQIFVRRILPNVEREAWFERHGMPADGTAVVADPQSVGVGDPAVALERDRRFGRWLEHDGPRTYLRYLATHPGFVLTTPFGHDGALDAVATGVPWEPGPVYASAGEVVPDLVERSLWPLKGGDQTPVVVLAVGIVAAAAITAVRSASRRTPLLAGFAVLALGVVNVVFVTHTAGWEYERLLVPTSVAVRIALLWMLAVVIGDVAHDEAPGAARAPEAS